MDLEPVLIFENKVKFRRNLNIKDMFVFSSKVVLRSPLSFVSGEGRSPHPIFSSSRNSTRQVTSHLLMPILSLPIAMSAHLLFFQKPSFHSVLILNATKMPSYNPTLHGVSCTSSFYLPPFYRPNTVPRGLFMVPSISELNYAFL